MLEDAKMWGLPAEPQLNIHFCFHCAVKGYKEHYLAGIYCYV
jgi:hypothetical protein